jgi:hydrogenase maturation protease
MNDLRFNQGQILVIGIGNIGRGDDGLGWKLAEILNDLEIENVTVEYRYQLQVEDAHLVSEFRTVIFIDASHEQVEGGFSFKPCLPADHYFYSSHMQSPETILYLTDTLYKQSPEAFILAIEGEKWDLGETISGKANQYLQQAFSFLQVFLSKKNNSRQPVQMLSFAHTG